MSADEGHQEAETNEHHEVDILIHGIVCLIELIGGFGFNPEENSIENQHQHLNDNETPSEEASIFLALFFPVLGHLN